MSGPLIVSDQQITSSMSDDQGDAPMARIRSVKPGQKLGYWKPIYLNPNPWIQVTEFFISDKSVFLFSQVTN